MKALLIISILFWAILLLVKYLIPTFEYCNIDMNARKISFVSLISTTSSSLVILFISSFLSKFKIFNFLSYIGTISIIIYLFHLYELPIFMLFYNFYSNEFLSILCRLIQSILLAEIFRFTPYINKVFKLKEFKSTNLNMLFKYA